jgi:ketosteroid isomerase-like protein
MGKFCLAILALFIPSNIFAQADLQSMLSTERSFEQTASEKGIKDAFLNFLSDDSVIFRPNPVNGKEFWKINNETTPMVMVRKTIDSDVASNGMMGYTTGDWRLYPKGKGEESTQYGQYVTVWEKRQDGKFFATVDISVIHDKLSFSESDRISTAAKSKDTNMRGWSVADASMNFLRTSMNVEGLAGAYKKFGSDEVRLLIEREPPVLGKKNVVKEMKRYISISFPKKVALLQAADMAYTWNPCEFANSNEGTESGNCLQIWKLRDKKWSIVLSVYARVANETKPELKIRQKKKLIKKERSASETKRIGDIVGDFNSAATKYKVTPSETAQD